MQLSHGSVSEFTSLMREIQYVNERNLDAVRAVVPNKHVCRVIDKCLMLRDDMALYVPAFQTANNYCAVIHITDKLMDIVRLRIGLGIGKCFDLESRLTTYTPPENPASFWKKFITDHFGMWDCVNRYVLEHGPLRSIKHFRN